MNKYFLKAFSNLRILDIFGRPITFETKDSENFKTYFGGLLTVITGILMIIIGFIFGEEIYQRENPNVLESNYYQDYSRIDIN